MAQKVNLYSILASYADKNNSPYIDPEEFIFFLEKYAKKAAEEHSEWMEWVDGTRAKFKTELAVLLEEEKCELLNDTPNGRIYIPRFCHKIINKYYVEIEGNVDFPFPNEESLGIPIPPNQYQSMGVDSEFYTYLENGEKLNTSLIRLIFPGETPSALVLSSIIPQRLLEACILKIRNYLDTYGNKEYAQSRLSSQLKGKEAIIRDIMNKIVTRPMDCYSSIAEGGEFSCLFWSHLCILVKIDIEKKIDRLSGDIAAVQSAHIIETMNAYYKALASRAREKELAFRTLEQNLARTPYTYTMDQIIKFTGPQGIPLLRQYSKEELGARLETLINESKDNKLPRLLVIRGPKSERYYVLKNKLLLLCNQLITETREILKNAIIQHWFRLLKNYQKEPAMENDKEFEKLLSKNTAKINPMLNSLLEDPKLQIVYDEHDKAKDINISYQIFSRGVLIPLSSIFLLRRKDLLGEARFNLPLWHSLPFIVSLIAFFKNIGGKKSKQSSDKDEASNNENSVDKNREMQYAAKMIEQEMVPQEYTIDSYLEELKSRWVRVIDKKAGENLVEDVNSLVRDNLRQTLRLQKHYRITHGNLRQLATNIVNSTPSLNVLNARNSLRTYIEIYLIKLLGNSNFFS